MLKKILIIGGILIGIIIIVFTYFYFYLKADKNTLLNFITENPERTSILFVRNDSILASKNIEKNFPLASTVKIIIAIEYAEQSAKKSINPDELISLAELKTFYVQYTDGGAHEAWLESVKSKIIDNKISIREIAKGMIKFSSNANTEWLISKLGYENINNQLTKLQLPAHSEIYYLVSSLFVSKEAFPKLKDEELLKNMKTLPYRDFVRFSKIIHEKIKVDTNYIKDIEFLDDMDLQEVWSNNLPNSNAKEYVSVMKKINNRTYFDKETQQYLDEVMEFLLENPKNKSWLKHAGSKGGSTAFLLTKALYTTDKKDNKTELSYFLNNLSFLESMKLQASMNEFELNILNSNKEFRKKVVEKLK
jgi:D-alanyl-D-alanine carboxypeptidase